MVHDLHRFLRQPHSMLQAHSSHILLQHSLSLFTCQFGTFLQVNDFVKVFSALGSVFLRTTDLSDLTKYTLSSVFILYHGIDCAYTVSWQCVMQWVDEVLIKEFYWGRDTFLTCHTIAHIHENQIKFGVAFCYVLPGIVNHVFNTLIIKSKKLFAKIHERFISVNCDQPVDKSAELVFQKHCEHPRTSAAY